MSDTLAGTKCGKCGHAEHGVYCMDASKPVHCRCKEGMAMTIANKGSGWGMPGLAHRFHFFKGGISLCRKWMYFGECEPDNGKTNSADCKDCRRRFDKQKVADATA